MPYALYIDESGEFLDATKDTKPFSLIAGWIATNNRDHKKLREELQHWQRQLNADKFHATEWRRSEDGRKILNKIMSMLSQQEPYAVVCIKNEFAISTQNSPTTYLDMLVELLSDTLFRIRDNGKAHEAFPLQIYIAERSQPLNEVELLLKYRLRNLLSGSHDKSLIDSFELHLRKLNLPAKTISSATITKRTPPSLMPELVLADFLCNDLYRKTSLNDKPKELKLGHWWPSKFEADPFWRDVIFFEQQKLYERLVLELTSAQGRAWRQKHPNAEADTIDKLKTAVKTCLTKNPKHLVELLKSEVVGRRDWEQLKSIIAEIELSIESAPQHLQPFISWNVSMLAVDVANHMGDGKEAARRFDMFYASLNKPGFNRLEFIREIPEFINRHAVSITDRYDFSKAEKYLKDAIAIEETYLKVGVSIGGKSYTPEYSDALGKLYSTLGQLYTKRAVRDLKSAKLAIRLFIDAEKHLQQSFEPSRQANYRIEALLSGGDENSDKAFNILSREDKDFSAEKLLTHIKVDSFDILYWIRWIVAYDKGDYGRALLGIDSSFLDLDGKRYPEASILYHFGRLAYKTGEKELALTSWIRSACMGQQIDPQQQASVLDTLRLRPLAAIALNFPDKKDAAESEIRTILASIKGSKYLNSAYFSQYINEAVRGKLSPEILEKLEVDIPYS